ncbi:MAG TPA: transporter substrate-binding domain-containing protein [Acetobacteraceae bacterium]|jgi:polar amino acid transport system substrate-binding protein|nr:transporter substrate-binding domain-containing protein [Acetobacteraceae bacterium]
MQRRTSVRWNALAAVLCAAIMTLVVARVAHAEGTLDKIKRTGVFLAGVRYDFPPVGTIDLSGNPVGFGPDLAKAIADKLGVPVKYVQSTSQNRMPLLLNGQIDAEIGITTPFKSREETADFTIPYAWDSTTILVHKGDDTDPKHYGPPKKVATTQGSGNIDVFKRIVPDANFVLFQEYPDAFAALQNHKVDAVVLNRAATGVALKSDPNLAVGKDINRDVWGILVRPDDSKWRNFLNWTLQDLWASGEYQKIYAKWFGEQPWFPMWSQYGLQPGIGGAASCCGQ